MENKVKNTPIERFGESLEADTPESFWLEQDGQRIITTEPVIQALWKKWSEEGTLTRDDKDGFNVYVFSPEVIAEEVAADKNVIAEKNEKGFQLVKMNIHQMLKAESLCICDYCNNAMFTGVFIGALNRIYCNTCFAEWDERSVYSEEDAEYENKATERLIKVVNS